MAIAEHSTFSFGGVVNRTFSTLGRNIVPFLILALIATLPQVILSLFVAQSITVNAANPQAAMTAGFWLSFGGTLLIGLFFSFVLQAALVHGTVMDLNGRPVSIGDSLMVGLKAALPLLIISILFILGLYAGFILLIIPGFMLLTMWAVVVPAYVVEGGGIIGPFGRSRALTKGHRWTIFGLMVVYALVLIAIQMLLMPVLGISTPAAAAASGGVPIVYTIVTTALSMVTGVIGATGIACIYYELRASKEGVGPEQLAAVFA